MRWILSALNAASKSRTSDPGFSAWISWISSGSQEEDDDGLVELHGGGGGLPSTQLGTRLLLLDVPPARGTSHMGWRPSIGHEGLSSIQNPPWLLVSAPFLCFTSLSSLSPTFASSALHVHAPLRKRPRLQPCHGLEREAFTETSPASVETRLIESNLRAAAAVTSICFLKMSSGS